MTAPECDDLRVTVTVSSPLIGKTTTTVTEVSESPDTTSRSDIVAAVYRERRAAAQAVDRAARRLIPFLTTSGDDQQ